MVQKKYHIKLDIVENEGFVVPEHNHDFHTWGSDIEDCVRTLDGYFYAEGITGYKEDYTTNFDSEGTQGTVSFNDSDYGMALIYKIREIEG